MAYNKSKLAKGLLILGLALPLLFAGPALYHWVGAPAINRGDYSWALVTVAFLFGAAILGFFGLKILMDAFFKPNN
jgi:hypothetical protein